MRIRARVVAGRCEPCDKCEHPEFDRIGNYTRVLWLTAGSSRVMQYVCDAPPNTWFRIETEGEAALESRAMNHAVEKYFGEAHERAAESYVPPKSAHYVEQNIGLKGHIHKVMPHFLTLRDSEGK